MEGKGGVETITLGMLRDFHKEFLEAGGNEKKAQLYNNVVNKPLLRGQDSEKVISLVNFPELHVLTGVVGKVIKELQRKAFKSEQEGIKFLDKWMKSVHVEKTVYHGSASFVGGMAVRLLNNLDSLRKTVEEQLDRDTGSLVLPFIEALDAFNSVRVMCFGQQLVPGFEEKIEEFSIKYRSLNSSVSLKVHLVESHLQEFLEEKGGYFGAGYFSEQAMESCHYDFGSEWEGNKVPENHPDYGTKLLRTVVRYNGKHL